MKRKYIRPEVEVIDIATKCTILTGSEIGDGDSIVDDEEKDEFDSRYNHPGNSRPGSGNIWDQGW